MDNLWLFLEEDGVEPTNNLGERALRFGVLWRKRSNGTQSDKGDRWVERFLSNRPVGQDLCRSSLCLFMRLNAISKIKGRIRLGFRLECLSAYPVNIYKKIYEKPINQRLRIIRTRQFALYLLRQGIDAYVPETTNLSVKLIDFAPFIVF